jgi:hypothetical protein
MEVEAVLDTQPATLCVIGSEQQGYYTGATAEKFGRLLPELDKI